MNLGAMNKPPKRLSLFRTGLWACDYFEYPTPPYRGAGWHAKLMLPKSELPVGSMILGDKSYPAKEVIIAAETETKAQRAADLIHAARLVLDGYTSLSQVSPGEHAPIRPWNRGASHEPGQANLAPFTHKSLMTLHVPLACLVAARASAKLKYVYALAKLRLSFDTFSVPPVDLDPREWPALPKSGLPEDHVRCAFAIVAAWSSIEELGLEIRASQKKPSKLADGGWNPEVRTELEGRLRRGHINLKELFHWNVRGPRTRIELKRGPDVVKRSPWARQQVRDGLMEVVDAIHYASFLRSCVAAHKADKRLVRVLSVYDVANVQFLARRLLLENLNFWRFRGARPG